MYVVVDVNVKRVFAVGRLMRSVPVSSGQNTCSSFLMFLPAIDALVVHGSPLRPGRLAGRQVVSSIGVFWWRSPSPQAVQGGTAPVAAVQVLRCALHSRSGRVLSRGLGVMMSRTTAVVSQ